MLLGFAGTPPFAATILDALLSSDHKIELVLTQPGKPAGRGRKIRASPVETLSRRHGIPVHTPTRLQGLNSMLEPLDALVVAAYGLILPRSILNAPRLGCLNVHASLLPRWRGAAPIEHAISHGDAETGVSIMQLVTKLDAGPVYQQASMPLTPTSTTAGVSDDLAVLGAEELVSVLNKLADGDSTSPMPQCEAQATYAPRLTSNDARIDWTLAATSVERQVRAFHGRGMAFGSLTTNEGNNVRVRVLQVETVDASGPAGEILATQGSPVIACGSGALALKTVQLNIGKGSPMQGADAVNGFADLWQVGRRFDVQ